MRVLVVEDNELVLELVRTGFENAGWQVDTALDCAATRSMLERDRYDAVVLDIELPDGDGLVLLAEIRKRPIALPVVMLTARSASESVIESLDAGADDYVRKPFDVNELVARVLAVLRRANSAGPETLRFGDLTFNRLTRETTASGRRIRLTPKEQAFLEQLLLAPSEYISREELLRRVWRITFDPGSNLLDAHVARLRHKLKNASSSVAIVTRRGAGFGLELTGPDSSIEAS